MLNKNTKQTELFPDVIVLTKVSEYMKSSYPSKIATYESDNGMTIVFSGESNIEKDAYVGKTV